MNSTIAILRLAGHPTEGDFVAFDFNPWTPNLETVIHLSHLVGDHLDESIVQVLGGARMHF